MERMECTKSESDPGGELYQFSQSDYRPNGIKEDEDDPLLIRCPLMKTANEVSFSVHCMSDTAVNCPKSFLTA
jgi:hypothetical protein